MKRLEGKIAIITGGGTGIGAATARRFAKAGASVVVCGRRIEPLDEIANEIGGLAVQADVTKVEDCARVVEAAKDRYGVPNVMVLCAGVLSYGSVIDDTDDQWRGVLATNLDSIRNFCKLAIPGMIEQGGGSIVTLTSSASISVSDNCIAYNTSKHAIIGLSRSMALDHGPQGVRVNCLCPGNTESPMLDNFNVECAEMMGCAPEEVDDLMSKYYPLRRIAKADEIAACAEFLASDDASYVTGAHLVADGGGHIVDIFNAAFA